MKYKILCSCAVFVFAAAMAPAQTKSSMSGKCSKPDVMQSVPAGDQPGHAFTLVQGKCNMKGETGGVASKEGVFSEHGEMTGSRSKASGVYVDTLASGDKIFYNYQASATMKNGVQTGGNKYQVTGGTGKMKGIKGSGTCTTSAPADGDMSITCTGEYTLAGAAPAKN